MSQALGCLVAPDFAKPVEKRGLPGFRTIPAVWLVALFADYR